MEMDNLYESDQNLDQVDDEDEIYEKIEAPKYFDFTREDQFLPDDGSWFCMRIGVWPWNHCYYCVTNGMEELTFVCKTQIQNPPLLGIPARVNQNLSSHLSLPPFTTSTSPLIHSLLSIDVYQTLGDEFNNLKPVSPIYLQFEMEMDKLFDSVQTLDQVYYVDEILENLDAPMYYYDLSREDQFFPDDWDWFCMRVGCDQNHEYVDHDALHKNFVLRVMAARSPNIRLRKALRGRQVPSAYMKCPKSAPAKPSKPRVCRFTAMTSVSQKMVDVKVKVRSVSKSNLTPSAKPKETSAAMRSLTTPRVNKCIPSADHFRSVQNPKTTDAALKNKMVGKALVFNTPKKSERKKSSLESETPITDICDGLKKLQLNSQRKKLSLDSSKPKSCNASRPKKYRNVSDPSTSELSSQKLKTRVKGSEHRKVQGVEPSKHAKSTSKCLQKKFTCPRPHSTASSDMEIDGKSRNGSLGACPLSEASKSNEGNQIGEGISVTTQEDSSEDVLNVKGDIEVMNKDESGRQSDLKLLEEQGHSTVVTNATAKALLFKTPKGIEGTKLSKSGTPLTEICDGMKKLVINSQRKKPSRNASKLSRCTPKQPTKCSNADPSIPKLHSRSRVKGSEDHNNDKGVKSSECMTNVEIGGVMKNVRNKSEDPTTSKLHSQKLRSRVKDSEDPNNKKRVKSSERTKNETSKCLEKLGSPRTQSIENSDMETGGVNSKGNKNADRSKSKLRRRAKDSEDRKSSEHMKRGTTKCSEKIMVAKNEGNKNDDHPDLETSSSGSNLQTVIADNPSDPSASSLSNSQIVSEDYNLPIICTLNEQGRVEESKVDRHESGLDLKVPLQIGGMENEGKENEDLPDMETLSSEENSQTVLADISSDPNTNFLSNSESCLNVKNGNMDVLNNNLESDLQNETANVQVSNEVEQRSASEEVSPPATSNSVGTESIIIDIDDKENAAVSDYARTLNLQTEAHENQQKMIDSKVLKGNPVVTTNGSLIAKYKKTKPTNPKPFRLRTDERVILREANLEKRHLPPPLTEPSHIELDKQSQKLHRQQRPKTTQEELKVEKEIKRRELPTTKSQLLRQQHIRTQSRETKTKKTKTTTTSILASRRLSIIMETSAIRRKDLKLRNKGTLSSAVLNAGRVMSQAKKPLTVPKGPSFHKTHTPKSREKIALKVMGS